MDKKQAMDFLRAHQPLPPDEEISQEIINEYDSVRKFFLGSPDKESIALFLGSFGEGDGLGVYQLVEDTILAHNSEDVIPILDRFIKVGKDGQKYWSIQIAANYSDELLLDGLAASLAGSSVDVREAAVSALERIGGDRVKQILTAQLQSESDEGIKSLIKDILLQAR